ncbi:MAG: glycosyltransferase family 4 protein [Candidatus Moranbacteria bacterium]|nr:glycosyltransferase family 4 protein [Candidatus Moranbacteria bacterium]
MKTLTLFFTYGASLETWSKAGGLKREIDIYSKLLGYFDRIYFITYGKDDLRYVDNLPNGITVLPKKFSINNLIYSLLIPLLYKKEIMESSWLKTNQMSGSWSAVLAKIFFRRKLNIRTGYTESLSYVNKSLVRIRLMKFIEFMAYKFSDIAVVTSDHQKKYILEKYSPKKIFIIPNGINTEIFKPAGNKIPSDKIRLLFVGRLHPEKNILNLLEAVKDLNNIKLRIIGQGPLRERILEFKDKYGLDLDIADSGIPYNRLPEIYNWADIYIQPSIYEGNPKTILEAMSCSLPVIASDVPGINNVINHRESGYLCGTDQESIKAALAALIDNYALSQKISSGAREFIEKEYNLEKIIKQEINLYEDN